MDYSCQFSQILISLLDVLMQAHTDTLSLPLVNIQSGVCVEMTELLGACFKRALRLRAVQIKTAAAATDAASTGRWKLLPASANGTPVAPGDAHMTQTPHGTVTTSLRLDFNCSHNFGFFNQHDELEHDRLLLVVYRHLYALFSVFH